MNDETTKGEVSPFEANEVSPVGDAELAAAQARLQEENTLRKVRRAISLRVPNRAPQPTEVHMRSARGTVQMIYDDGSVRNTWQRMPGLSGRQFRKGRKALMRARREAERKALQPIIDLLPVLPGHRHAIGDNLLPTCGCEYSPEALVKLRELVQATGTPLAEEPVNPVSQLESEE